jgi:hypothetical protein
MTDNTELVAFSTIENDGGHKDDLKNQPRG